jgi:hypothetical protein
MANLRYHPGIYFELPRQFVCPFHIRASYHASTKKITKPLSTMGFLQGI